MARIRSRKSRARHFTPPSDLLHLDERTHPKTPSRCGVLWAKAFSQELNIPIPQELVRKITGVAPRVQTRILASKQVRTRHNQPDSGPDPRGRKRAITRTETAAISDYLEDSTISLDDKGKPWLDVAQDAGVELPITTHFKPPGLRTITPKAVQRACKEDEGIINAVCEEEKELTKDQVNGRLDWIDEQLSRRPHSRHWKDIVFCDEFHFGIGPQVTKRIKRKQGRQHRYKPENVHRKKVTAKDTKAKAREKEHLKLLNVFVAIGYNWRKIIPYEVPNNVGKMTTKVYTTVILPLLKDELQDQDLTLCQDADSAHDSNATLKWAVENNVRLLTLPGVSPDLSILETMAHPLKKAFHAKRCTTEKASLARFKQIFEEMDQKTIQNLYNSYTKRLHDCRRAGGQMTKY
jgi:hypothetical protein